MLFDDWLTRYWITWCRRRSPNCTVRNLRYRKLMGSSRCLFTMLKLPFNILYFFSFSKISNCLEMPAPLSSTNVMICLPTDGFNAIW